MLGSRSQCGNEASGMDPNSVSHREKRKPTVSNDYKIL
jgi:hypothetical protein